MLGEGEGEDMGGGEPDFPLDALARLDEMIHRQRWVVPVLPKCELEVLLEASIDLCQRGELAHHFVRLMYLFVLFCFNCLSFC